MHGLSRATFRYDAYRRASTPNFDTMTKPDTHRQTRRRFVQAAGVTFTTTGATALATTASADESGDLEQGILADGIVHDTEFDIVAFFGGYFRKYQSIGPPEDAYTLADRARNEFNANADLWVSYGNWLFDEVGVQGVGDATVAVDVEISRGRWPTRDESVETTIDVGYDDTEAFESLEWRDEPAEDPDFEITLENHAAENAADELQEFRRKWIGDGENDHQIPDDDYLNELAGAYTPHLGFGADSKNVLELLLGEIDV